MQLEDPVYVALFKYTHALSVALGYRDQFTRLHSERVRCLAGEIGLHCGLSKKELNILNIGSSFHDIGKIGIPDNILLKPGTHSENEREQMHRHAEIGADIMLATELEGAAQAARVIRHHHEYYDGGGYPDNLSGEEIPICSRIISIADSYDAMSETRPYHRGRKHPEIMQVLRDENGQKHDPQLMHIFFEIIETSEYRIADS